VRRPTRRGVLLLAVAVLLLAGGAALIVHAVDPGGGPDATVTGYFAALQRGDAPAALAYGDVPPGDRTLLTADALHEQLTLAPLTDVRVTRTSRRRTVADVTVRYRLGFPGAAQDLVTTVPVHRTDGRWRLARTAIATTVRLGQAGQRATVLGTRLPDRPVLLFPGAVPIRLDTPYLQLIPGQASVDFGTGAVATVGVTVSAAGRRQAGAAVLAGLRACLAGRGPITCPQPDERYLPGTLRGTLATSAPDLDVTVGDGAAGVLEVTGQVPAQARYQRLAYDNRPVAGHGRVELAVTARGYATAPLRLAWTPT
jgi:hypothetical protein